jgi:hypothetical protein
MNDDLLRALGTEFGQVLKAKTDALRRELKPALDQIEERLKSLGDTVLALPQPAPSVKALRIEDGMLRLELSDGATLFEKLPPPPPGPEGQPGIGIKSVTQDGEQLDFEFDNGEVVSVVLPRGEKGEKGDKGDPGEVDHTLVAVRLLEDSRARAALRGEKGEKGADADPDEVAARLGGNDNFIRAVTGPRGEEGPRGEPGLGFEVKQWAPGVYRKGDVVQYAFGRLARAKCDTYGNPGRSDEWERIGTGGFDWCGVKQDGRVYQDGDLYIDNGTTFLVVDGKARIFAKRGTDGKDGTNGSDGVDGASPVGFKFSADGSSMLTVFDNGKSLESDLPEAMVLALKALADLERMRAQWETIGDREKALNWLDQMIGADAPDAIPVRTYRGTWRSGTRYERGDTVTFNRALWVARESTSADIMDPQVWVRMVGGGSGTSGKASGAPSTVVAATANALRAMPGTQGQTGFVQADNSFWIYDAGMWKQSAGGGTSVTSNYHWSSATSNAPADGAIRVNHPTIGSANRLMANVVNANGGDVGDIWRALNVGDIVQLQSAVNLNQMIQLELTAAPSDHTTYVDLHVKVRADSGFAPADGEALIATIDHARGPVNAADVSIVDQGNYLSATNVEGALQELSNVVFAPPIPTPPITAPEVSVTDAGNYFTGTNVEAALQELGAKPAPTPPTAAQVPIVDAGGHFTATNVETALQELATKPSGGTPTAAQVTIADAGGHFSSADVEGALQELATKPATLKPNIYGVVDITNASQAIRVVATGQPPPLLAPHILVSIMPIVVGSAGSLTLYDDINANTATQKRFTRAAADMQAGKVYPVGRMTMEIGTFIGALPTGGEYILNVVLP